MLASDYEAALESELRHINELRAEQDRFMFAQSDVMRELIAQHDDLRRVNTSLEAEADRLRDVIDDRDSEILALRTELRRRDKQFSAIEVTVEKLVALCEGIE